MAYTSYPVSGFDAISSGLSMLGTDVQNYQKQQRLADLGQKIQSGDIPGAAKVAFDAGDPATGLKLMTLGMQQQSSQNIAPILGMPTDPNATPVSPEASPYSGAISGIESGGKYDTLGPVTSSGDRAHGKYQVMGENVGPWTKEILGQEMTPEQFLANPYAQEKVFSGKFGQFVKQTGNPQDAASMWFTGKPLAEGADKADQLGTTGRAYVAKFNSALGQSGSGAVASDDANATKRTYLQTAQNKIIAAMAQPNLDEGTRSALKSKLDVVNKNLADIKSEEDKAFTTMTPEEFKTAYPGQQYPANAIVGKDAAGKPAVIHLSNERIPNDYTKSQERAKVLQDQGIDPNSAQGREYILTGRTDVSTQMKATEQKMFATAQDKVLTLQQSIADLEKAKQLNPQAYSGNYQPGAAAFIHRNIPGGDMLVDPNRVTATTQFENLVTGANAALGKEMFGARVTNYDEQILQRLRANPKMGADERAALLDQMIAHRKETLNQVQGEVSQMKAGTRFQRDPNARQPQTSQQLQGAAAIGEGATATNPQTGEKVMFRGGQWVPVQ